ncbi:MAG: transglutaminase domain-containing protein [Nitrospinae bacterium]|nr:transglutaminase domain-containing protein [Nitrospinota bacterium]
MNHKLAWVLAALFLALPFNGYAAEPMREWQNRTYEKTLSENWMNIFFQGQKIGFSFEKVETGPKGFRVTGRAVVKFAVADTTQDMSFSQTYYLEPDYRMKGFVSLHTMQNQRQQTVGEVAGKDLNLDITGAGGSRRVTKKLETGVYFAETLELMLKDKLKPGFKGKFPIYLAEMRAMDEIAVEVIGRQTIQHEGKPVDTLVTQTSIRGISTKSYIGANGEKLREESPMGFTSIKVSEREAISMPAATIPITSLITFSLIKPSKPIKDPLALKELKLTVGGFESPVILPSDERQTTGRPEWRKGADGKSKLSIPVTIKKLAPKQDLPLARVSRMEEGYLKPTPEIQSDNKLIASEARKMVGHEKDAYKAAILINRWVFSNVKKKLVDSFTAIDVLLSKEGECQSHTNLFAALARSVGIPTRVAAGLVYSVEHQGFLFHAWPEVYVGQWISVDPTLGQDVADATHIKLTDGEYENLIKLLQFLVKINITVEPAG